MLRIGILPDKTVNNCFMRGAVLHKNANFCGIYKIWAISTLPSKTIDNCFVRGVAHLHKNANFCGIYKIWAISAAGSAPH